LKKRLFYGDFIIHPINILAVILLIFNDFYLKPSQKTPFIAGKLSDIALMIFLPIFICFFYVFIKYFINTIKIFILHKDIEENYNLSLGIILFSLIISGAVLTLLQLSDSFNIYFEQFILFFKNLVLENKVYKLNLTKDYSDIFVIVFLAIPYFILRKEMDK
jgi:hypothetical protein